uniref:Claudin 15 n=1 Tax=Gopherus evgoodei TaxID=1825980 RepID=A0A8C5EZ28_9SAUR
MAAAVEAGGFFLGTLGWGLLGVTLPNSYWRVSTVDGSVITTSTLFENLWQSCATDSTGVYNCREFPSMLALSGYLQACRALMITALLLGCLAALCGVVGMKCTKVADGNPEAKGKMAAAGGCMFILAGLCGMVALSWYAFNITRDFFDPLFPGTKYEIGPALYLGWSGSLLGVPGMREGRSPPTSPALCVHDPLPPLVSPPASATPTGRPGPAPSAHAEARTPAASATTARTPTFRCGDRGVGDPLHPPPDPHSHPAPDSAAGVTAFPPPAALEWGQDCSTTREARRRRLMAPPRQVRRTPGLEQKAKKTTLHNVPANPTWGGGKVLPDPQSGDRLDPDHGSSQAIRKRGPWPHTAGVSSPVVAEP